MFCRIYRNISLLRCFLSWKILRRPYHPNYFTFWDQFILSHALKPSHPIFSMNRTLFSTIFSVSILFTSILYYGKYFPSFISHFRYFFLYRYISCSFEVFFQNFFFICWLISAYHPLYKKILSLFNLISCFNTHSILTPLVPFNFTHSYFSYNFRRPCMIFISTY